MNYIDWNWSTPFRVETFDPKGKKIEQGKLTVTIYGGLRE